MSRGEQTMKSIWDEPLIVVLGGVSLWNIVWALKRLFLLRNDCHDVLELLIELLASIMRIVSSLLSVHFVICWVKSMSNC